MTIKIVKLRPYFLLLIGLACSFFSFDGILTYYHFCSSNKVVDSVSYQNQTYQLTSCEPRLSKRQKQFYIDDIPLALPRLRYKLEPKEANQALSLQLVGHSPTFFGNLSKLHFDQLRQQPQNAPQLGLQLPAEMLAQPGPRNLEVKDGQLRVVFGNGKYLAFAPKPEPGVP